MSGWIQVAIQQNTIIYLFIYFSAPDNDEELTKEAEWIFEKFTTKTVSQQETLGDKDITRWLHNRHESFRGYSVIVYDHRNHYFGFGPLPNPKLVDTFGRYRNRYRNHISKGKSSYQYYGVFFQS